MANKNMYEIFDEFKKAKSKADRIAVLRKNDCKALRDVLLGALHPSIQFTVDKIPDFKRVAMPAGMSYDHMSGRSEEHTSELQSH